jgi:hypothetical protein
MAGPGDRVHDRGLTVRRLLLLLGCLAAGAGCVTPQDKGEWAEAMRDLRGDNMRMRSGPGASEGPDPDRPGNPRD